MAGSSRRTEQYRRWRWQKKLKGLVHAERHEIGARLSKMCAKTHTHFALVGEGASHKWMQFLQAAPLLGRARLKVESALWSHVCVVVVGVEEPPPPSWLTSLKLHVTMQAGLWSHV